MFSTVKILILHLQALIFNIHDRRFNTEVAFSKFGRP